MSALACSHSLRLFSTVEDASADRFRYADFPLPMSIFDLLA